MATRLQDKNFADTLASPDGWLDTAIDWISTNLNPEEVFSHENLAQWARDNGFKEE